MCVVVDKRNTHTHRTHTHPKDMGLLQVCGSVASRKMTNFLYQMTVAATARAMG